METILIGLFAGYLGGLLFSEYRRSAPKRQSARIFPDADDSWVQQVARIEKGSARKKTFTKRKPRSFYTDDFYEKDTFDYEEENRWTGADQDEFDYLHHQGVHADVPEHDFNTGFDKY